MQVKEKEILHPELSYAIMGVVFEVHSKLGNKFQEKHYQRAIEIRLKQLKIPYKKEMKVEAKFEGEKLGDFFLDFVVNNEIVLETKTTPAITSNDVKQVLRYLDTLRLRLAIIVNFRPARLEFKRVVL